ncbi:multi-sensor hybrid histidine kinase [Candidatus Magnetomorum sp. HK-1]|nr:multi-sensor hybrid histidine kinase [Candidatus Magnetomorum sp. HK-1]
MTKLLAIDDNQDNLTTISAILRNVVPNCSVLTAKSGAEGIEKAITGCPDAILLDILMPEMDGYEVCQKLKSNENTKHIPIILITATKASAKYRAKGLEIGADAFLSKPIDISELVAQVNVVLRIKKSEDNLRKQKDDLELLVKERTIELIQKNKQLRIEIEERKNVAKALSESKDRYQALINNILGMVYSANPDWSTSVLFNSEEVCGYTKNDFCTQKIVWLDIIHPDDKSRVLKEWCKLQSEPTGMIQEYRIVAKDGNVRWVRDSKRSAFKAGVFNGVDGVVTDITYYKQQEEKQKKQEELIQQSQKMETVAILAGGIAHDFNNILGVIMGNASQALSHINKTDYLFDILNDIHEGAKQAKSLTQQLLTFARGGAPIKKVVDLNQIIKESVEFATRGEKTKCEYDLSKDLWAVEVDTGQINQTLNNLVINANQAMPDGGIIHIKTENTILKNETEIPIKPGKYVIIKVSDQGIGISDPNISKIFDPYFSTKQKGSGLGLATSYSIISRHGGHISVNSQIGHGTTFIIYLPISDKSINPSEKNQASNHKGAGKILVMDDQEPILKMIGRMLNRMGYETVFAKDGDQAISIYRKEYNSQKPFDLVILDLTIPGGMGGAQTMPELLKIDPNVKAIVSSGYSNDPIMANYQDYGFSGVIPKPYSKNQLAKLLNTVFN